MTNTKSGLWHFGLCDEGSLYDDPDAGWVAAAASFQTAYRGADAAKAAAEADAEDCGFFRTDDKPLVVWEDRDGWWLGHVHDSDMEAAGLLCTTTLCVQQITVIGQDADQEAKDNAAIAKADAAISEEEAAYQAATATERG